MDKRKLSDNELNKVAGGNWEFRGTSGDGMIPCETCGFMIYPDFIHCPYCGAPVPMLPPEEQQWH